MKIALVTMTASLLALLAAMPANAQVGQRGGPLDISADRSEIFDLERKAILTGNVDVRQGDERLLAQRMEIFFASGTESGWGDVREIQAFDEVFYITPTERTRADKGSYDIVRDVITMEGDVVVTRGQSVATGDRLIIEIATGKSTFISDDTSGRRTQDRVRIILNEEDPPGAGD